MFNSGKRPSWNRLLTRAWLLSVLPLPAAAQTALTVTTPEPVNSIRRSVPSLPALGSPHPTGSPHVVADRHVTAARLSKRQQNRGHRPGAADDTVNTQLQAVTEQWLNQFGQAEVNLQGGTGRWPLGQGRLAMLLPWRQRDQKLLFTKGSIERSADHTTLNLGIGHRWLNADQGYWGYNLFYDHRLQGSHRRLGAGLEYSTDPFSFALNGYFPISDWRGAPSAAEWGRPAQGFDIRCKGYLPKLPQLGFSLMGERYWGDQIALLGPNKQQRNPQAVTIGVDYTPVPLLNASYAFKIGTAGKRDHQLQLNLTYRFGVPLAQQLDPAQVAQARSNKHNPLQLVQHNNQVLLAYQPNELLQINGDSDTDSEASSDTDSDTDSDADSEAGSEAGSEASSEASSDTDSDADSDVDSDAGSDAESDAVNNGIDIDGQEIATQLQAEQRRVAASGFRSLLQRFYEYFRPSPDPVGDPTEAAV